MHRNVCSYRQTTIKPRAVNSEGKNERLRTLVVCNHHVHEGVTCAYGCRKQTSEEKRKATARFYDPLTHPAELLAT